MSKRVKAKRKDTLCTIAIREGGFLNCDALRNAPGNEGYINSQAKPGQWVVIPKKKVKKKDRAHKTKSRWKKKNAPIPSIRFVHGSENTPYAKDETLTVLQVSNYPTDKGGPNQSNPFPSTSRFDDDADIDPDTFKVEVVDYGVDKAKNTVEVQLEVLKPKYQPDGKITYESFIGAETDVSKCKIKVECERVSAKSVRFRSKYMRLVVDLDDFNAAPDQTLLVPDIADGSGGDKDKVEILDQQVRTEYDLSSCPKKGTAAAKCIVHEQLPIGEKGRKKRVKMVVHILRDGRGGPGVVTEADARKACLQYIRQLYAQAELSVKLIDPEVQLVQPPKNMIVIDNKTGRQATGGKKVKIRIKIDAFEKTLEYTTGRKDSPKKTAGKLAKEIRNLFAGDLMALQVTASRNPPVKPFKYQCSADVLVGNPSTQDIELEVLEQHDPTHIFEISEINATVIDEFDPGANEPYYVGTVEERVLLKNYNSGKDRIDHFIVEGLSQGSLGESFWPSKKKIDQQPKRYRPITPMVNSTIVIKNVAETTDFYHTTITHEMGHVLMDTGNHITRRTDLMVGGSNTLAPGSNERVVNGPKRISDESLTFDDTKSSSLNPVSMFRDNNKGLIDGW